MKKTTATATGNSSKTAGQWPENLSFSAYKKALPLNGDNIYQKIFQLRQDQIQIKKESIGVAKLRRIIEATFKLTRKNGFQAMTLRQLSTEAEMSMGGLYAYIASKEALASLIEDSLRIIIKHALSQTLGQPQALGGAQVAGAESEPPAANELERTLRAYIYCGEIFHEWFSFVYLEAKTLNQEQRKIAMQAELDGEQVFIQLLQRTDKALESRGIDSVLTASMILAVIEDWYLKRWKYRMRKQTVEEYADACVGLVSAYLPAQ